MLLQRCDPSLGRCELPSKFRVVGSVALQLLSTVLRSGSPQLCLLLLFAQGLAPDFDGAEAAVERAICGVGLLQCDRIVPVLPL